MFYSYMARRNRETKDYSIIFRITEPAYDAIEQKRSRSVGCKSGNQFARKILMDYLEGKLIYIVPDDRKIERKK